MATFEEELGIEDEQFPFPKRITRETFQNDLQIDPSNPAQSILRINDVKFNVDQFLYEHYRFTSLEDLQSELNSLLKDLDQELFNLVNNDYFDFINLGKSLEGGENLVDKLRVDVTKYQKKLADENNRLDESKSYVESSVDNLKKLQELKVILKQLTSLYLTIHQLFTSLPSYQFVANKSEKVNVLRYEFKGVLDEFLRNIRPETSSYKDVAEILGIYSIIGDEADAVKVLRENSTKT
ncbi:hypothetical protein BN7_1836 [Wickerhamomyces ciferrii]|uniref:Conserved oligomeric Golgi complex subunit 2 n=1 Tax=Wickerhamomyces ciferrii (strain ATCC 14091 / BCRC 22168 / CBS 111 / JCM 3599 / NBRC 0793 / NRRL Y-1031 F-60-10) TaxID=1206466 RepID=K0KJJ9_WICCF|nr:uncharacterized protein BN7_1836 [Wickerhamomyces ciferrii]CCH42292.1 hypothetical protein BN7_1836 [Wickerhamomyces ciferrii]